MPIDLLHGIIIYVISSFHIGYIIALNANLCTVPISLGYCISAIHFKPLKSINQILNILDLSVLDSGRKKMKQINLVCTLSSFLCVCIYRSLTSRCLLRVNCNYACSVVNAELMLTEQSTTQTPQRLRC